MNRSTIRNLLFRVLVVLAATGLGGPGADAAQTPGAGMQAEDRTGMPVQPAGPYYALVIGNDNYRFLPKLQTAANDAKAIAHLLSSEYGFGTSVLLDATRADILEALSTYKRKLPPNSNLVIYYAGHGTNDSEAKVAYWLPVDAKSTNNANWISADDITAELRVIKALHVLVIADSCYSGALMRGGTDLIDINGEVKPQERNYYLAKLQQIKSRNILASGGNEPVADGGTSGHSIFAAVVLQSLRELETPQFTAASLFQHLIVRVAGRSQQTPQYSAIVNSQHDGGDFIFFRQPGKLAPPTLCCSTQAVSSDDARARDGSRSGGESAESLDVESVLMRYRSAYENEDVGELQRLWPTMSAKAARDLRSFFLTAHAVALRCDVVGQPVVGATSATINIVEQLSYTLDGRAKKSPPQKTTLRLSKVPGGDVAAGWKIESIQ